MIFFTRYIIEKTYSAKELGYFSSITLIMLALPLLTGPALSVLIPGLSGLYAQKRYAVIRRMAFRACVFITAVTAALCASSLVWGRFALRLLFGDEILPYSFLLMPTLLASGFLLGCGVLAGILTAMRRHGSLLIAGIAAALTAARCCPALVRRFYMGGAIYSLVIAYTVQGVITLAVIMRNIKDVSAVTDNKT